MPTDTDEKMPPANPQESATNDDDDEPSELWKPTERVMAVWAGNGCSYAATIEEVDPVKRTVRVVWDDQVDSHRTIPFDQVRHMEEEMKSWSAARIDKRASVRPSPDKGRCLFTNETSEAGDVVFIERPLLVALPAAEPKLWEHLTKLHEAQPLNLGTVTFHYAGLLSQLQLDEKDLGIILDKFVPDPDEDPGEDVIRILQSIKDNHILNLKEKPIEPRRLQRLVSAWRYNSFGHHKEDGLVLYNRISMCAHSCDPSCCWSYGEEDAFVLRARIALQKDAELTISYLQDEDLLKSTAVRQQKLQNWRFTCMCSRCCKRVDVGRGFKCRRCHVGVMHVSASTQDPSSGSTTNYTLEPCHVCTAPPSQQDQAMLLQLEEEYVARVESLDKNDVPDVQAVYQAAIEIFEKHWILYVMDTILWEAHREKNLPDAIEHQRRRVAFHEHYYCRPTFILAWCHEELGDSLTAQFPNRKWHASQEFNVAYRMLVILCGTHHQYTSSPYNKLFTVQQSINQASGKTD